MNILLISLLAVIAVIIMVMLKPKNGEIAIMLGISASVIILLAVLSQVTQIMDTINNIIAVSGISTSYIVILLKVIGICLITEFAVNTCKDAGSQSLAGNVSLAGKILITITALPLYSDILNTVIGLINNQA
ncbi:MAG: SpoIIIAC/SpoIIIAD family protein [Ruminococcus sp.]|nr:SpoIIIAC/SpoIIIAD family protein [Ruminococcus sp.]